MLAPSLSWQKGSIVLRKMALSPTEKGGGEAGVSRTVVDHNVEMRHEFFVDGRHTVRELPAIPVHVDGFAADAPRHG